MGGRQETSVPSPWAQFCCERKGSKNPNYKEKHNILNENSVYDDSVSGKNSNLPTVEQISIKEKYDIIRKAYIDTLKKYGENQALTAIIKIINEDNFKYFTGVENKVLLSRHVIYSDIHKQKENLNLML